MELPHSSRVNATTMAQPWKKPINRPTVDKRHELSRHFIFQGISQGSSTSDGSYGGFWGERMRINDDHTFSNPPPYKPGTTGRGEIVLREGLLPGVANIEKIIPHRV